MSQSKPQQLSVARKRSFGFAFNAKNVTELASPKIKPKILIGCCTSLKNKLGRRDELVFNIVDNAYLHMLDMVRNTDVKTVGNDQDSFSMIEAFGVAYPIEWNITDEQAKVYVFDTMKKRFGDVLSAIVNFDGISDTLWNQLAATIEADNNTPYKQARFYSLLASTIYSLCRQGAYTRSTADNLTTELSTSHGLSINLSPTGVNAYWANLGKTYTMDSIQDVMEWILPFLADSIRLKNLVKFSENRGLNIYYQVRTAMGSYPTFEWHDVFASARSDFENYQKARELVKDRPFFGYNADIGVAASTFYPTLGYVSLRLNEIVGGQTTLNNLVSRIKSMVNTARWDKLVRAYRDRLENETLTEEQRLQAIESMKTYWADFSRPYNQDKKKKKKKKTPVERSKDDKEQDDSSDDSSDDDDNPQGSTNMGARGSFISSKRVHESGSSDDTSKPPGKKTDPDTIISQTSIVDADNLRKAIEASIQNAFYNEKAEVRNTEDVWEFFESQNLPPINYLTTGALLLNDGKIQLTLPLLEGLISWCTKKGYNVEDYQTPKGNVPSLMDTGEIPDHQVLPIVPEMPEITPESIFMPSFNLMPEIVGISIKLTKPYYQCYGKYTGSLSLTAQDDIKSGISIFGPLYDKVPSVRIPEFAAENCRYALRLCEQVGFDGWYESQTIFDNSDQVTDADITPTFANANYPFNFVFHNGLAVSYTSKNEKTKIITVGYTQICTWREKLMNEDMVLFMDSKKYMYAKDVFNPVNMGNFTPLFWALMIRASLAHFHATPPEQKKDVVVEEDIKVQTRRGRKNTGKP